MPADEFREKIGPLRSQEYEEDEKYLAAADDRIAERNLFGTEHERAVDRFHIRDLTRMARRISGHGASMRDELADVRSILLSIRRALWIGVGLMVVLVWRSW